MSTVMQDDRRKLRRLPAAVLSAELKGKKGLFKTWLPTNVIDFNVDGIAVSADPELDDKQSVTLKINLKMDMGDIHIEKIDATIRNRSQAGSIWRYGMKFDFSSIKSDKQNELKDQLSRISRILEKNSALQERMKKQN